MQTCPNCGELLGDSVKVCFKCHYSFTHKRVITNDEYASQKNQQMEDLKKREEELERKKEEFKRKEELKNGLKKEQLPKNPLFEYQVIVINDLPDGQVNYIKIQETLNEWSDKGWRLHSVYSSEIGKNSTAVSILGFGSITNATIDQTVMIFERCIKA